MVASRICVLMLVHEAHVEIASRPMEERSGGAGSKPLKKNSFKDPLSLLKTYGYTLGPQIGKGSYATVQLATRGRTTQCFAVKIISKSEAPRDFVRKFLPRELDVIKRLKHQHLVKFFQAIETTRRVYIIMEFVENGSLLDRIRQEQHIEEDRSRLWFKQLVDAVEYCHNKGVVHRDIKCENILLDSGYKVKLTDFGFARGNMFPREDGRVPSSETYCGSYAYAPPEIIRGIPYNPLLADIWSMGVVLYAMLFGKLPFETSNNAKLLKQMESRLQFPRMPVVSRSSKHLLAKILTSSKWRLRIPMIKQDRWLMLEQSSSPLLPDVNPSEIPAIKMHHIEMLKARGQD